MKYRYLGSSGLLMSRLTLGTIYIALIKPATHYCEGCGRSAAKAENLCKPQQL